MVKEQFFPVKGADVIKLVVLKLKIFKRENSTNEACLVSHDS